MQIRYEKIDFVLIGTPLGHIDNRQKRPKIIANMKIVIGPDTGQNYFFTH
jgi:hypothetical protein